MPALKVCFLLSGATLTSIAAAQSTVSTGSAAESEQNAGGIEEIIVTNQFRAYRGNFTELETPQAIQVLDTELMNQAGVTELTEALSLSAAISRQNNFGGLWNSFAVRGFAGDGNLPSNFMVNGFNAGRGFGGSRDIAGIEAVEVLKGPSAALFGRGEPGGTVNLRTKRPTGSAAGQLRISADDFGTVRADADYSSDPIADRAAVRMVGFFEDGDSFRDTVTYEKYGVFPSMLLQIADGTTLVYELEASRQKVPFDRGIVAVDGNPGQLPPSRFLGEPGDGPMDARVLGHQLELNHEINQDWALLLGANFRDTSLAGFSSDPEFFGARQRLSIDGRNLTRQRRHRAYDAEYAVLRAELSGQMMTGPLTHRIIVGVDSDRFKNDQQFRRYRAPAVGSGTSLQDSYAIDIYNPVYGQFPLPATSPLTDRREVLEATGLYVQDQINLTEQLQIRLGFRHDDFSQRTDNRLNGNSARQSDTRISPQLGLVYAVNNEVSLYSTYGEGFRANSGADFTGRAFDPNQSSSLEAGVKFELMNRRLQGNVAIFEQKQKNMLSSDAQNPGFSVAIGEARSCGLEFDLMGRLAEYNLHISYAYIDAEASRGVLDTDFGRQIASGDRLINVPRHTLSTQISRDLMLAGQSFTVGGGVLYVGERLGETATDFTLPAYTLVRLHAGYNVSNNITLRAELDNAFDKEYFPNSYAQVWIQPGTPRRARLSAEVTF
ncbi:MAG: TonB-dependent siderophore receptor [Pseudohongiella sp.]|uniref:TonB-dependent siderophore receptor n=1 Tax=Pseudohongiella sp. TaxID=1979412 RepID=UPI00349FE3CE